MFGKFKEASKNIIKRFIPQSVYAPIVIFFADVLSFRLVNTRRNRVYRGVPRFNNKFLMTDANCDFMEDVRFKEAYRYYESVHVNPLFLEYKIYWRIHVVLWAANLLKHREGDFVECGVYRGGSARAIVSYTDFGSLDKQFFLLDTYAGIETKYVTQAEKERGIGSHDLYEANYYDAVVKTFEEFENVKIIKGPVPDTLSQVTTDKVALLLVDMNNVTPEIAAANFFWEKLISGAIVIVDDYGFATYIHTKKGWDEFAKQKGVEILSLPTGQGLLIKP